MSIEAKAAILTGSGMTIGAAMVIPYWSLVNHVPGITGVILGFPVGMVIFLAPVVFLGLGAKARGLIP